MMEIDKAAVASAIATKTLGTTQAKAPSAAVMARWTSAGSQDEHPSTNIPFIATIDGRQFNGTSISLVSATIAGLANADLHGAERVAILRFGFAAYAITIPVNVHISRTDTTTGSLQLDFIDPAGEHLPALRYLLNSYVAGDVVSLGEFIAVRDKSTALSTAKPIAVRTTAQRVSFYGKSLAVAGATLALVAFAGSLAYDRLFSSEVAQLGAVAQGNEPMRAIVSGQLAYLNPAAAKGEVVYAIQSTSGDTLNVVMPCDCQAFTTDFLEGSTILTGETVVNLLRPGTSTSVVVAVSASQAKDLIEGDVARLQFSDGASQTAILVQGATSLSPMPNGDTMRAVFALQQPVTAAAAMAPVSVRILDPRVNSIVDQLSKIF
jgi:mannuronan synthase